MNRRNTRNTHVRVVASGLRTPGYSSVSRRFLIATVFVVFLVFLVFLPRHPCPKTAGVTTTCAPYWKYGRRCLLPRGTGSRCPVCRPVLYLTSFDTHFFPPYLSALPS